LFRPLIASLILARNIPEQEVAIRVAETDGSPIGGAEVLLFYQGGPVTQVTDSSGIANIKARLPEGSNVRIITRKDGYEIQERFIQLPVNDAFDIRLNRRSGGNANVIFRVIDDLSN